MANAYNSLWQVRNDSWCSLEEAATQLALAGAQQRPVDSLSETVHGLLDVLGPIERFWAFPGLHSFAKARRLFGAGKYDRFAALVSGINRALVTDSHRSSRVGDTGTEDEAPDHIVHPMEQARTDQPYFEVLIVEDMSEQQEQALREELRRWRRPDDPVLVPGQVFSREILSFMRSLDTPEVHGYRPDLGYRVYTDKALEIAGANSRPVATPETVREATTSQATSSKPKRKTEAPRSTSA